MICSSTPRIPPRGPREQMSQGALARVGLKNLQGEGVCGRSSFSFLSASRESFSRQLYFFTLLFSFVFYLYGVPILHRAQVEPLVRDALILVPQSEDPLRVLLTHPLVQQVQCLWCLVGRELCAREDTRRGWGYVCKRWVASSSEKRKKNEPSVEGSVVCFGGKKKYRCSAWGDVWTLSPAAITFSEEPHEIRVRPVPVYFHPVAFTRQLDDAVCQRIERLHRIKSAREL